MDGWMDRWIDRYYIDNIGMNLIMTTGMMRIGLGESSPNARKVKLFSPFADHFPKGFPTRVFHIERLP